MSTTSNVSRTTLAAANSGHIIDGPRQRKQRHAHSKPRWLTWKARPHSGKLIPTSDARPRLTPACVSRHIQICRRASTHVMQEIRENARISH